MVAAMARLLLAKLSVATVAGWFGLAARADDNMDLLQRILSLVLAWDAAPTRRAAEAEERAADGPVLRAAYPSWPPFSGSRPRSRLGSRPSTRTPRPPLADAQHVRCLAYYAALLAVRDAVAAYEPKIRSVHARVDLRKHLDALWAFVDDLLRTARAADRPPVADYVALLRRNRALLYRWLHAVAAACPDAWLGLRLWARAAARASPTASPASSRRSTHPPGAPSATPPTPTPRKPSPSASSTAAMRPPAPASTWRAGRRCSTRRP